MAEEAEIKPEVPSEEESTTKEENHEHTEDYDKLIEYGINAKVAEELDDIYKSGILSHGDLDERALDALKEFPAEDGIGVLKEFQCSNLDHVSNKSAFLCGVMKTYRQKNKMAAQQAAAAAADQGGVKKPGPDEAKLKELLDRTGYTLDVTTGQRKYGGPPPGWGEKNQPGPGHEVFAGKIPKDMFEDELVPLFENCGPIWDFRLMMEPLTGLNRGYAFVTFTTRDAAQEAVKQLDNYEIKPTRRLKVNVSVANVRLFVGNIPKSKTREEIIEEFSKLTESLTDVIVYNVADDAKKKNRGFAFLEYDSHKSASVAKRKLGNGRQRVWNCDIIVDWADPQEEPDEETMSKVKVLYVRNLKQDVTEDQIREKFEVFGKVERVKKIKDYGFVHFEEREHALAAMKDLNGKQELGEGSVMEISLAKPPTENKKKEQRKREQAFRYEDFWGYPGGRVMHRGGGGGGGGGGRGGRPPMGGYRGGFNRGGDFYYDEMGYDGYHGGYADDYYGSWPYWGPNTRPWGRGGSGSNSGNWNARGGNSSSGQSGGQRR
ncbi:hypothetical protein CAPTEDRAFT_178834 [Capitella teleta]|uniref:RRM domain-containing protein n=1 Tax=Capitella teleta TaxID=283909 RepID=R7VKQ8_CAPTE|nr:hypothetical protein CAPTEDRAFT_178834 [Capitella teleta]|eukprot:ELU17586.1 hypothetical protein CAPTEDRAFT_178834 [Capitella teleta]